MTLLFKSKWKIWKFQIFKKNFTLIRLNSKIYKKIIIKIRIEI